MSKELFKEAIADAKAVREAALANAKAALEEALTPKLQSMLAAKLNEIEEDELEESKKDKEDLEEVDLSSNGQNTSDIWHNKAHAASQADAIAEGEDELEEDFDLSEILAELNESDDKDADDVKEVKEEETEEEETEETEEEGGEEEVEVKDMTIEDLKNLIKDIVSQEIEAEEAETPADEEAEEAGEETVDMGDMGGEEIAAGTEDEIDLEELLAELDSLDEADDKEEMEEAKKKEDKKEKVEEGLKDFILKAADNLKKGLGLACTEEYEKAIKAGKTHNEAVGIYNACLNSEKGGKQGVSNIAGALGGGLDEMKKEEELEEAISTINTLRNELNEVNLLNAKLLYVNKLFKAKNLTESQKLKVIASFDKATNVKEAKVVFESLQSALNQPAKKAIKESLGFASKAVGVAPNKAIVESNDVIARMQKLANIK